MNSEMFYIITISASLVFFFVARKMFCEYIKIGASSILAAVLGIITMVGFLNSGEAVITAVLIPYQAAALTMLIMLPLWFIWRRLKRWLKPDPSANNFQQQVFVPFVNQSDEQISNSNSQRSSYSNRTTSECSSEGHENSQYYSPSVPHIRSTSVHVTPPNPDRFICPGCGEKSGGNNGDYCPKCEAFVHRSCAHHGKVIKERPFFYWNGFGEEEMTCPICKTVIGKWLY